MSVWQLDGHTADLTSVRVTVEAFLLEDLLETLAQAAFPINPQIEHHAHLEREGRLVPAVHVEFPAWSGQLPALQRLLEARGFVAQVS